MTIYCDNELCGYNDGGFCWADKLHLDSNGVCTTESNSFDAWDVQIVKALLDNNPTIEAEQSLQGKI